MSERSPQDQNLQKQVEDRAHELLVEHLAYANAMKDPLFREAMAKRKAAEIEAEGVSRLRLSTMGAVNESASEFDEHPWGIDYLKLDRTPEAIFERAREKARGEEKPREDLDTQRTEALEAEMAATRQLTMAIGKLAAERLAKHKIPTNIQVIKTQVVRHERKFSKEELRMNGHLRAMKPAANLEDTYEGWELPISGQVDRFAKAILCQDGRILTAYGEYKEPDKDKPHKLNKLYIQPNTGDAAKIPGRLPIFKRTPPEVEPGHTYSSYLDEHPESDLGMAILPKDTAVAKAHIMLSREQDMQEAIVSLLIEHNLSLVGKVTDDEQQTAVLEHVSAEEKAYRDQGGGYDDPRITEDKLEALKGPANLVAVPHTVEVTDYVTSKKEGDDIMHYFQYKDKDGQTKYSTLDKFVWSHMPEERRKKLRDAGLDPDDLEIGQHPILKPYW